jgi:SAM-dependent methyltransferase
MKGFSDVTELNGQMISREQLLRFCNRYQWASKFVKEKDVLEIACGGGQGLSLLSEVAKSVTAGDVDEIIVGNANLNNSNKIAISKFSADKIPYENESFDAVIIFEAIYYFEDFRLVLEEVNRVLRKDGILLIATANPELYDFTASANSVKYYSVLELDKLLKNRFVSTKFFGFIDVDNVSLRQKFLRPVKALMTSLGLVPKTMKSKEFLKRFFFGSLIPMPAEVSPGTVDYVEPITIDTLKKQVNYKVIYSLSKKDV